MLKNLRLLVTASLLLSTAVAALATDYPLFAGQNTQIGTVEVTNVGTDLTVVYHLDAGWFMTESHLQVTNTLGGFPQMNGNPQPGLFANSRYYNPAVDHDTYNVDVTLLGSTLYIAAHAKVEFRTDHVMNVFTRGVSDVMVMAGNDPDKLYPFPAVAAWEAFNDPTDDNPSYWDSHLVGHTFTQADWVWESFRVLDPTVTQQVTFKQEFTVPGVPTGGEIFITADNLYSASLNGNFLGENTDYNLWPQVGHYPLNPVSGLNSLDVIAANYGGSPGGWTLDNNPGGLIYEANIDYYTVDATGSAWAGTLRFPGKNWATYFEYTLQ